MDMNTKNRVNLALDLMARNGWGIERAAKEAKTTRRTVKRFADKKGIGYLALVGTNEMSASAIPVKNLATGEQITVDFKGICALIKGA